MHKNDFETKLGKIFKVNLVNGESVELKLISVDTLVQTKGLDKARKEPFSLVFIGSDKTFLPDNTYSMSVDECAGLNIFISAFKNENEKIYYDSIFN